VRIYVVGLRAVDGHAAWGEEMAIYLQLDAPSLREVARMTGDEYHYAGTAEDLRTVHQNLGSRPQLQTSETELTALLALLAAVLVLAASSLSLLWFERIA
jgi:Ca-activated chloride channel family protein